ncbi:MAG TPA: signal peptidase II [Acidimicrobiales bacterium]|nr:signal peptidase II [Acidimicrobiales bacterium]
MAFGIAAVILVADWFTTSLAVGHLHRARHLWGPTGLALTYNSGLAFSIFSGRATVVTVLLCGAVFVLGYVVAQARTRAQAIGGGLVLGGAIGNLGERIFGGHNGQVPDFITLSHWPTFNVADACVSVGVVVVAASLLFGHDAATPAE